MSICTKLGMCLSVFALAVSGLARAQEPKPDEAPATAPAPAPEAAPAEAEKTVKWYDAITAEALVDLYYAHNFGIPSGEPSQLRTFDGANDTFGLAFAKIALTKAPEPVGFRLDLGFGSVADATSVELCTNCDPGVTTTVSEVYKHVEQAYASFKIGAVTLDAGKFVTAAGAEVIEAKDNWNYSRSILFGYAIPFTHTGLRLTAPVEDFTLQASLVNAWDFVNDNNKYKTLGLSVGYKFPSSTQAILNAYLGPEGATSSDWRWILDLVVSHSFSEMVGVKLNADYGKEDAGKWYGVAANAKWHLLPCFSLSGRLEYFGDPDGIRTGSVAKYWEGTVTAGFPFSSNGEIRAEFRHDQADASVFAGGTSKGQNTVQLAFLAWL